MAPPVLWTYAQVRALLLTALCVASDFEEAVKKIEDAIPRFVHPEEAPAALQPLAFLPLEAG